MKPAAIFFWCVCFFLGGVFIASAVNSFYFRYLIGAILILLMSSALLFIGKRQLAVFSLIMLIGAGYFFWRDKIDEPAGVEFGKKAEIHGIVKESEQRLNSQKVILGNIQITTSRYPVFHYGDEIKAIGAVSEPAGEWKSYFDKEGIIGLMQFPKIERLAENRGSPMKAALLKIRAFLESSFKKVLPFEKATFLSGLTLGSTNEFSDEFEEKLRLSGTSHLVALSGYNISIIAIALSTILGAWWVTKKFSFPISVLVIAGFVIMTGAEASVVRAAIMGLLLLLADKIGRVYDFKNAVAAAAIGMVLWNPKFLVFDIGFQLSFAALLGIVYLRPYLTTWLKMKDSNGFLNWRQHFLNTTSAQLAVLPLLIYHFSFFSPFGILANVLILEFVPITMVLGFFIGLFSIFSYHLAWLISFPTSVFLGYELFVIDLWSQITKLFI